MNDLIDDLWPIDRSVMLTSFWGWTPETWSTVGWTGDRGRERQRKLMSELTDPFITVCYVTQNKSYIEQGLKGYIAGFYVVTHQTGDRDDFTHPHHHKDNVTQWRHSNKAVRAFSYLPECRIKARDLDPQMMKRARSISAMGEVITSRAIIDRLRAIPCEEVPVYQALGGSIPLPDLPRLDTSGYTRAGPASNGGYWVDGGAANLPRELYILQLTGEIDAYLGKPARGQMIVKIGMSASPELRRQSFQKALPDGCFRWIIERSSRLEKLPLCRDYRHACVGENELKRQLSENAEWLGGEFYLVRKTVLDTAWKSACQLIKDTLE